MHATSGSVPMLCNIIVRWLEGHKEHLSKSEFSQVATMVRDKAMSSNLFRTKRAAIDYSASYPDPQCRIGESIVIRAASGVFNGQEVSGKYAFWNPLNGRTAVESAGVQVTGFYVRKGKPDAPAKADDKAA